MADQLAFDTDTARRLENLYRSEDIQRRRRLVLGALAAEAGEDILDIGCGPGFYVAELAGTVGTTGTVTGVDPSVPMLAVAEVRTADHDNVTLLTGEATALPVSDQAFDAAICVQVLEYVQDVAAALSEVARVLRPGGRLVVWDVDWSTLSWHSADPDRMVRVLAAWDQHLTHPVLPRTLKGQLSDAGFVDAQVVGHAFTGGNASTDTYGGALIPLIEDFVANAGIPRNEAAAWRQELMEFDAAGTYYCTVTQVCFSATKPR